MGFVLNSDDFVKSPTSLLGCIFRHCGVLYVRRIPQDLRALKFEAFSKVACF